MDGKFTGRKKEKMSVSSLLWEEGLTSQLGGYLRYFTPRPFAALARPLPRVPRSPPRAAPPLPAAGALPPRGAPIRDAGAGVENLGVGFEEVGGFSTKDVSVVLCASKTAVSHMVWPGGSSRISLHECCLAVYLAAKPIRVGGASL